MASRCPKSQPTGAALAWHLPLPAGHLLSFISLISLEVTLRTGQSAPRGAAARTPPCAGPGGPRWLPAVTSGLALKPPRAVWGLLCPSHTLLPSTLPWTLPLSAARAPPGSPIAPRDGPTWQQPCTSRDRPRSRDGGVAMATRGAEAAGPLGLQPLGGPRGGFRR